MTADASDVRLTLCDATRRVIKCAKVFALYLPGVNGTDTGEWQMLFEYLGLLSADDLLVLDRGYPASWLIAALQMRAIKFCMRIDNIGGAAVTTFLRSGATEAIVMLAPPIRRDASDLSARRSRRMKEAQWLPPTLAG